MSITRLILRGWDPCIIAGFIKNEEINDKNLDEKERIILGAVRGTLKM